MRRTMLLCGLLLVGAAQSLIAAEPRTWKITYDRTKSGVLTKTGDTWTLDAQGQKWSLSTAADGTISVRRGETLAASGKQVKTVLEMKAPAGALFLKLELKADKTRVWTAADAKPLECKVKEGQVRVSLDGKELGRVKYYPDAKKAKAKTTAEEEVAVVRNAPGLTAGLAPFLMGAGVPEEKRLALVLLLASQER